MLVLIVPVVVLFVLLAVMLPIINIISELSSGNFEWAGAGRSTRLAFAAGRAAYLRRGIGPITVDIATNRHLNLRDELAHRMGLGRPFASSDQQSGRAGPVEEAVVRIR